MQLWIEIQKDIFIMILSQNDCLGLYSWISSLNLSLKNFCKDFHSNYDLAPSLQTYERIYTVMTATTEAILHPIKLRRRKVKAGSTLKLGDIPHEPHWYGNTYNQWFKYNILCIQNSYRYRIMKNKFITF